MEGNLSPTIRGTFLWNLKIHSHSPHPTQGPSSVCPGLSETVS